MIGAPGNRAGAEINRRVNLPFAAILKGIIITRNGGSQHDGNRAHHDTTPGPDKLQVKSLWNAVTHELNIKCGGLPGSHRGDGSGVIDDLNPGIGGSQSEIDGHLRGRILDGIDHTGRDTAGEARGNLKVKRVTRSDGVGGSVVDGGGRAIDGTGQFRDGLEPLAGIEIELGIGSQSDHQGAQGIQSGNGFLQTGSRIEGSGGTRRLRQGTDGERDPSEAGNRRLSPGLIGEPNVGGEEHDGQRTGAEATATDSSRRGQHAVRGVGHKRSERGDISTESRRELGRHETGSPAVEDGSVVVAIKPEPGDQLVEGLDVGLGTIAAIAGCGPIQGCLDRRQIAGGGGGDDRLIQNERATGGVLGGEIGVLFEAAHAKAQVDSREGHIQRVDDGGKRAAYDGAVAGETAGIIEEQKHIHEIGQGTGTGQREADRLPVAGSLSEGGRDAGRADISHSGIAGSRGPECAADRVGIGVLVPRLEQVANDIGTGVESREGIGPVDRGGGERFGLVMDVVTVEIKVDSRPRHTGFSGVPDPIAIIIVEAGSMDLVEAIAGGGVESCLQASDGEVQRETAGSLGSGGEHFGDLHTDHISPGGKMRELPIAGLIDGGGKELVGHSGDPLFSRIEGGIVVGVQPDRQAVEPGLSGVAGSIGIRIVEDRAGDDPFLSGVIAEVDAGEGAAIAEDNRAGRGGGIGGRPACGNHFEDRDGARIDGGDCVGAVGRRDRTGLGGLVKAVVVEIDKHGTAGDAGI